MDKHAPLRMLLLTMRLVGHAPADRLGARLDHDIAELEVWLASLAAEEIVVRRDGQFAGWSLTERGRALGADLLAAELDDRAVRSTVEAVYERFMPTNQAFLQICTDWQVRPDERGALVPNDHVDVGWDRSVFERLEDIHIDIGTVIAQLGAVMPRYWGYLQRFEHARQRLVRGDRDWFTKPLIDSYHTVWFELHEDLLATLGKQRCQER